MLYGGLMRWLDRLEQRFGRLGIPNLIFSITAGRALAYVIALRFPAYVDHLVLYPAAVWRGEVWRLATFLFTPPMGGLLVAIVELYFTFLVGSILERYWGDFKFTFYYLFGAVATALVSLILRVPLTPSFLNVSLFLAFATLFPDFTVLLFFIIPVKVKYLGWFSAGLMAWAFWASGLSGRMAILAAFGNYLIFFSPGLIDWVRRRKPASPASPLPLPEWPTAPPTHLCAECGATEHANPDLEFRWCSCPKCGDGREFCMPHLRGHLSQKQD